MINRVLIRIKVVQMLYSYLLTEKHFTLEPQPAQPTKEKRFSYKLYLDTLALIVEVARHLGKKSRMADNRFVAVLSSNEVIKSILSRQSRGEFFEFQNAVSEIADEVKASGIYKLYIKNSDDDSLAADVKVWRELYEHVIKSDRAYNVIARNYENYSLRGMERMSDMMIATFGNFMVSHGGLDEAERQLRKSLDKARELYIRLLLLPVSLVDLRTNQIEAGRAKKLPTDADINPDMRLLESPLVTAIEENESIRRYADDHDINWLADSPQMMESILKSVLDSEAYAQYCHSEPGMKADYIFWKTVLSEVITTDETFLEEMESKSVFWNDDIDIMTEFAIKTLRRFEVGMGQDALLSMYKARDDEEFARKLFALVIQRKEEYRAILDECLDTQMWESGRLAYMDVIIILTAMAEMLNFPSIPLKVTINEYIEMAKSYSSAKSGAFINGLLGVIVAKLKREGKLIK